jgi:UDP-GlcNAc:undecaprenyl-phosphate GlcNAc-1-phosphate transferase
VLERKGSAHHQQLIGFSLSFTDRLGLSVPKAILAWGLVVLIGGAAGLVAMLICNYMLSFGGQDAENKHGISEVTATRLGGIAIVAYMAMHLGYQVYLGVYSPSAEEMYILATCAAFFSIGMYEDLKSNLSARNRFSLMLMIGLATIYLSPGLILQPVDISWVDTILSSSAMVAGLFTAVCIAFIPNAFNTADGANGLVAGVSAFSFMALITVAPATLLPFLLACLVGCLVFLVFNLISGRFFLGDGGAYFLGALAGLSLVVISNTTNISVWWLLSLVFYPVADLLWSIGRRAINKSSPFAPDNQHFHNLLFAYIDQGRQSSMTSNTTTGLLIAFIFSGSALFLSLFADWGPGDPVWFWWVCGLWIAYGLGWRYLNARLCALPTHEGQM